MTEEFQNYFETDPDTGAKSYGALPIGVPLPEGAVAVDAQPAEDFASHCEKTGKLVVDHAARADAEAGPEAIQAARLRKSIEALMFKAGIRVDGYLAAEAEALGIDQAALADLIIEKAEAAKLAEVDRRIQKSKVS